MKKKRKRTASKYASPVSEREQVKTINDCFEAATVDAYNEDERATGWATVLGDILDDVKTAKVLGQEVEFEGIDIDGYLCVVAKVRKDNNTALITLDSIEFKGLRSKQKLWLKAWKTWCDKGCF